MNDHDSYKNYRNLMEVAGYGVDENNERYVVFAPSYTGWRFYFKQVPKYILEKALEEYDELPEPREDAPKPMMDNKNPDRNIMLEILKEQVRKYDESIHLDAYWPRDSLLINSATNLLIDFINSDSNDLREFWRDLIESKTDRRSESMFLRQFYKLNGSTRHMVVKHIEHFVSFVWGKELQRESNLIRKLKCQT